MAAGRRLKATPGGRGAAAGRGDVRTGCGPGAGGEVTGGQHHVGVPVAGLCRYAQQSLCWCLVQAGSGAETVRRLSGRNDGGVVRYRLTMVQVTLPFLAPVLLLTGLEGLDAWRNGFAWWPSFAWHELTGVLGACVLIAILTRVGRAAITLDRKSVV